MCDAARRLAERPAAGTVESMGLAFALLQAEAAADFPPSVDDQGRASETWLEDGSLVVSTGVPFPALMDDPAACDAWLAEFLAPLAGDHTDPRGVLVFPPSAMRGARRDRYETFAADVGDSGIWLDRDRFEGPSRLGASNTLGAHAFADLADVSALISTAEGAHAFFSAAVDRLMRDMLTKSERREPDDDDVVLAVRRRSPLLIAVEHPDSGVHEVTTLPDGTHIIRTTFSSACREEIAVLLAEFHTDWVAEHDDERGVPCFAAEHLGRVRGAPGYVALLERAGGDVEFLVPRTLMEIGVPLLPLDKLLGSA